MPEAITLVVVAVLGLIVGAVGVAAFTLSERDRSRADHVDVPSEGLPEDVLAVLTSVPGIVVVLDRDDSVIRADSHAYAKGLTRGNELVHPEIVDMVRDVRRTGFAVSRSLELPRSQRHPGSLLDFEVRVAALPAGRVLVLAEDRTLARRAEAQRRDFTANVSHELKTPVGAIRLLADTIAENPDDAEVVARFAPRLSSEATRLTRLVEDIIDLSRIQAPDALGEPTLVDVSAVVRQAVDIQANAADAARVRLIVGDLPAAPASLLENPDLLDARASGAVDPAEVRASALVWGDEDMLVTAVRNLLDNAVRYSEAGGKVSVGVDVSDDLVSVTVVDSGIGISAEDQERIFERFYRVDPARSRATGGTGLGLSIVKHVAQDHGGTVTVWSAPGRGSTFSLVLPQVDVRGEARDDARGRADTEVER